MELNRCYLEIARLKEEQKGEVSEKLEKAEKAHRLQLKTMRNVAVTEALDYFKVTADKVAQ